LAPTPPLRTSSGADQPRSDRKTAKTDEEKKKEFQEAIRMKPRTEATELQKDVKEETQLAMEDLSLDEREEATDPAPIKAVEDIDSDQPSETVPEGSAAVESRPTISEDSKNEGPAKEADEKTSGKTAEEEDTVPTPEMPMEQPGEAKVEEDDEFDIDAIEREIEEKEKLAAAKEAEYERKKQAEKEERERKLKEESDAWTRNMRNAEREAEAREEARLKELETGHDEAEKKDREELFGLLKRVVGTPSDSPAPTPPGDSDTHPPVSPDPSFPIMAPPARGGPKRPVPLKLETNKTVEPPQQTAAMKSLHSARFIQDPSRICYPPSIVSPSPALNSNAPSDRKFKYNKEFLLQFQAVFKEKPSLDWDARVRETVGDAGETPRPQSARPSTMGARNTSRPGIQQNFTMGSFGQPPNRQALPSGTTSEQRFALSNATRTGPMGASPFGQFGRPTGMVAPPISRTSSSAALHSTIPQSPRVGSSRGGTRSGSKRDKQSLKKDDDSNKSMPLTAGIEVKALTVSTSGWKPRSLGQAVAGPALGGEGHLTPDVVQRKVKANLNKMTPENFDRISDQILSIVSQSKDETDGRTLRQVIQLTFEKATDEAHWAPMYAKFCKRMLESMSAEIKDENIRDKAGNVVTGGSLFRKYLLNRCQEEFERGWKINLPERPEGSEETTMMSDEYYIAAAAKRRGLGLVKFIGELFKLCMLTERIMHECVKKLVDYEGVPDVAEVESLTSLLRTIGASLDSSDKGHSMMDAYFGRIRLMIETVGLPSRLKFMLMDVVDLRDANWRSKGGDKGPKTLNEIREEAVRQQHEHEMERLRQQANRGGAGRVPMGRGDSRNFSGDYRNQAPPQDFASSKVGTDDLRRLKTTRNPNQPISFGPSSMFGGSRSSSRKTLGPGGNLVRGGDESGTSSRTGTPPAGKDRKEDKEAASSINAFSALASLEDRDNLATSPPSNPSSPPMAKTRLAIERRQASKSSPKDGDAAA
jgi:translation initiation factor 4G